MHQYGSVFRNKNKKIKINDRQFYQLDQPWTAALSNLKLINIDKPSTEEHTDAVIQACSNYYINLSPLVFLLPKTFKIIWLSNILALSVPDEGNYLAASCALNLISTFSLLSLGPYIFCWTISSQGYQLPSS